VGRAGGGEGVGDLPDARRARGEEGQALGGDVPAEPEAGAVAGTDVLGSGRQPGPLDAVAGDDADGAVVLVANDEDAVVRAVAVEAVRLRPRHAVDAHGE